MIFEFFMACPACGAALDPQVQAGFFWGLVFMMATPWIVVGLIGGGLYRAFRRERREAVERLIRETVEMPSAMHEESDVHGG